MKERLLFTPSQVSPLPSRLSKWHHPPHRLEPSLTLCPAICLCRLWSPVFVLNGQVGSHGQPGDHADPPAPSPHSPETSVCGIFHVADALPHSGLFRNVFPNHHPSHRHSGQSLYLAALLTLLSVQTYLMPRTVQNKWGRRRKCLFPEAQWLVITETAHM